MSTVAEAADAPAFIFVTCQKGAERALKHELSTSMPQLHPAFSRPGLVTFKLTGGLILEPGFTVDAVFARTWGFSLGAAEGSTNHERAQAVWRLAGDRALDRIHVWEPHGGRPARPGLGEVGDDSPANTEADAEVEGNDSSSPRAPDATNTPPQVGEIEQAIQAAAPSGRTLADDVWDRAAPVDRGANVLDCVVVDAVTWWIGHHRAQSPRSRWPGGVHPVEAPEDMVSRAYLKMEEALRWSRLPLSAGDACVEIGSAPGGQSQALLARGLRVTGIDPAEMSPEILANSNFRHLRMRAKDVRRREFRGQKWLFADLNVAPAYTLDAVEPIVTHRETRFRGLLITLKLLDWDLAKQIPDYVDRVRSWGFRDVRVAQLHHHRQEIAIAATRRRRR